MQSQTQDGGLRFKESHDVLHSVARNIFSRPIVRVEHSPPPVYDNCVITLGVYELTHTDNVSRGKWFQHSLVVGLEVNVATATLFNNTEAVITDEFLCVVRVNSALVEIIKKLAVNIVIVPPQDHRYAGD